MTKSEKERLAREIHKEIFRKISKDVYDVVACTIEERISEVKERESDYSRGREGTPWSPNEDDVLRREMSQAVIMIATAHRRTAGAIRARLQKNGIITDYSLLV